MNENLTEEEPLFPEAEIKFATFWSRFGAFFLDGIIILVITLPITILNVMTWKIPYLFVLTSLIAIAYKPFMEYRFGATVGKMAARLRVVGHSFGKVTLKEELSRVSFYLIPQILQQTLTFTVYLSNSFFSINDYTAFNNRVVYANPSLRWLNGIVIILLIADTICFFSNYQRRALHDVYAGTYVIEVDNPI